MNPMMIRSQSLLDFKKEIMMSFYSELLFYTNKHAIGLKV